MILFASYTKKDILRFLVSVRYKKICSYFVVMGSYLSGLFLLKTLLQTVVTPIVEGYGGWAFRMEIVPIESAYPGFGELVVSVVLNAI